MEDPMQAVDTATHWDIVIFFVSQTIIIAIALITSHVKTQVAIARVVAIQELHMVANDQAHNILKDTTSGLKSDHGKLGEQVGGISRSLARLEGHVNATQPFKRPEEDET